MRIERFRDITEQSKRSIFHMVHCSLISRDHFLLQRKSMYIRKRLRIAGDIGWLLSNPFHFPLLKIRRKIHVEFSVFRIPRFEP